MRLFERLRQNAALKLLSLVLAIAAWVYVHHDTAAHLMHMGMSRK